MPLYLFSNKEGQIKEVYLGMNDPKVYIENGVKWQREFTRPNANFDTVVNPLNSKDFMKRTANRREESKELSERRTKIMGFDSVKEKYAADWSKKRGGKRKLSDYDPNATLEI